MTQTRTVKQPLKHCITVSYSLNGRQSNPRPQLTIKGRWLEQLGFYPGLPVTIKIEQNKLIIEFTMRL
ncbi:type I toxin-antitoxin system SymE family toxin [Gilliamella sp. W8126]|nr:type I toxin-antitoxin system SymE family toxin [Gilliamella sp. W8126]